MVEYFIMRIRPTILTAFIAFGALCSGGRFALGDGPNAEVSALFAKVAAAYRNIKSVSMNMETVAMRRSTHGSETIKTRINLAKPNRLSAELTGKQGIIHVVADGKSVFTSLSSDTKKYYKAPDAGFGAVVQSLNSSGGCGIGLLAVLLTDPHAETKIVQGNPVFVRRAPDATIGTERCDLVNAQLENQKHLVLFTFAFAKTDHLLRRITVSDPILSSSPIYAESYSSIRLNPSLSAAQFRFTPPKGAVAIDPIAGPRSYDARIKVGAAPIPIGGVDLSGKPVSLGQYKGKVVLLDFWATWCGPCVHELPNVIAAYGKYHAQGFDVVGITLDRENSRQLVEQFVKTNQMPWRQVYDGKYWSAANAVAYSIQSIPFTLLIGRDGKVAAVGAIGPALAPAIEAALRHK